ncbi:MAG TPA: glycerophosphodiester phosphodiesterase family protein [Armatimonadota bacterium]|jgi:glycerophosphoryl diester phosphodiesterase
MNHMLAVAAALALAGAAFAGGKSGASTSRVPLVCAHRGASAAAPENTLSAFRLAVELGADEVELDTSLTSDGVPVVLHDGTVDRTTDGTGVVETLPLAYIKKLDAGSWKDPKYKGEPMPTLDQVFTMKRRPFVNCEIKANTKDINKLVAAVVGLIEKRHLEKKVIISSFSGPVLERVHQVNPRIATGFLYSGKTPETLPVGITALHPMYPEVTAAFMEFAHSKGLEVNVWTVDDATEMKRLIALGVNSIITNKPDLMRQILNEQAK